METEHPKKFKIALAHDFLINYGGAEKVLETLMEIFPDAPVFTLLHDEEKMRGRFSSKKIVPSYLQKFPKWLRKHHRWLMPFFMVIPETLDFRDFDLVISSSGAWMKGIVTKLNTIHVAYLHSPMRFVWDYNERYLKDEKKTKVGFCARFFLNYVRMWDRVAAERPDYIIANSNYTRERILKYYKRDSMVIYPPAYDEKGKQGEAARKKSEYFLIVSRLSPYKKIDLAIETFNKLELPLVVIGEGKQEKYLRKISGKNVKILGWQPPEKVEEYYKKARALIFPGEDDFGMTMVEAMKYGVPVIAYKKGGSSEIVEEGITGEFFEAQTSEVLADGVRRFIENENNYDPEKIMIKAKNFDKEIFKKEFKKFVFQILDGNHNS